MLHVVVVACCGCCSVASKPVKNNAVPAPVLLVHALEVNSNNMCYKGILMQT